MRLTKKIQLGATECTVHELTVAEVRTWMKEADTTGSADVLGSFLVPEVSLADLTRMSTATLEAMEALTQSELALLVATARELNPYFFDLRAKLLSFLPTS